MAKKLFEGLRIVEVTVYQTGPLTTQAFSNLGAEVIKIETGSQMTGGPGGGAPGVGTANAKATNKLSVSLNFANPKGLEAARRIIATADIFVENLAGHSLIRKGLGYEDLKKIKPDIIMLSTCMQGQTGPYATHGASGHKLSALSGFNHIYGWPDREPAWIAAYTDNIAPPYNVIAILAALDYRRRTGKGQFLDMSQNETGVQFMAPLILDYTANKRVANREGNKYPYAAPHNAYRCEGEDRWCAISVFTEEEWHSFCRVIGDTALAEDARFATLAARKENEEELDRLVNEWTINHSAEEVMTLMQEAGVAAGVVQNAEDQAQRDPQLRHRNFFSEVDRSGGTGTFLSPPGAHFLLSKASCELLPSPNLGEHNDYIFKELAGLTDEEITEMADAGIIE
ncbi:MAG: CoA transferase [Dehalococcoidales bacterium]|jgi:benzylsuccinate CoA-transferase BbsF subunit|nr:CoA transferase [Dehalococcoidales bacterium]MDP7525702.1 CoA transferase [Dehalococcoidales bacterium]